MIILGIDPGQNTGLAFYNNGKLESLETISPHMISGKLHSIDLVVFEDSRLQSHVWAGNGVSRPALAKIARNIGQVDAWCILIAAICGDRNIPYNAISPKSKGAKRDAAEFKRIADWATRSNQHERDAAMVAWNYRNFKG